MRGTEEEIKGERERQRGKRKRWNECEKEK